MIDWSAFDGLPLLAEEPLAKYTAARIGGPAERLLIARGDDADLIEALHRAWVHDVPVRILGGGANVLVSDSGVRGLVLINHVGEFSVDETRSTPQFAYIQTRGGTGLTVLSRKLAAQGIDFAWAVSVPGTIGGAVVNNAGAHGGSMADDLLYAEVLTPDGTIRLSAAQMAYSYRSSALKSRADRRFWVTRAALWLRRDDPETIAAQIENNIIHRKRTQPPGASLGSIFKNPPGDFAGRLIEACGLKGYSIGGALISPMHGNFFINRGTATAHDYAALIEHARVTVLRQTGVSLETEVELIGAFS